MMHHQKQILVKNRLTFDGYLKRGGNFGELKKKIKYDKI